jgi:hypothetical protein
MKHFTTAALSMLIALLGTPLCHAAAEEPLQYSKLNGVYDINGYRYNLWKPKFKQPYECSELTVEEDRSWFPPRPKVVDLDHYEQWEHHVTTVFGGPFHAPAECDTSNALAMLNRDYAWFIQRNPQLGTWASECDNLLDVPISLQQNLRNDGNFLLMHLPQYGPALQETKKRFTASRVNKIDQYRIGLLAEINGRRLCQRINCRFMSVETYLGLPYIHVVAEPQKAWENVDVPEERHVIPESLDKNSMLAYFDTYVVENQHVQAVDYERARETLDRYREIASTFQVRIDTVTSPVHTVIIPVIVAAISRLVTAQSGQLTLSTDTDSVLNAIAGHPANIRRQKDFNFFRLQLQNAHIVPRSMQGNRVAIRPAPEDEQPIPSSTQMTATANRAIRAHMQTSPSTFYNVLYPSWWGGFFAGLSWTGLTWAAFFHLTPYLRSRHESIVTAACMIHTLTACMPYLYAHRKVAQSDSNHISSDGICNGAHIGMIMGLGINVASIREAS